MYAVMEEKKKMSKSLPTIFDYFSESTDEVSERISADLQLYTVAVNNTFYRCLAGRARAHKYTQTHWFSIL